jgi:hypothetical protein
VINAGQASSGLIDHPITVGTVVARQRAAPSNRLPRVQARRSSRPRPCAEPPRAARSRRLETPAPRAIEAHLDVSNFACALWRLSDRRNDPPALGRLLASPSQTRDLHHRVIQFHNT